MRSTFEVLHGEAKEAVEVEEADGPARRPVREDRHGRDRPGLVAGLGERGRVGVPQLGDHAH